MDRIESIWWDGELYKIIYRLDPEPYRKANLLNRVCMGNENISGAKYPNDKNNLLEHTAHCISIF
ncbi:MAG: hypothetical protein ISS81_04830 [Candidatus Marinimicrobia bacterium]|nr:hypothetical protein [Candidatus Neomarinimicrobiota bacterium]